MYTNAFQYVYSRDGVFYYIWRVPHDVRQHYASSRISFSLRTNSQRHAFRVADSVTHRLLVFHSLRETVSTKPEQAGVPEGIAADILGHEKQTITYGLYPGRISMAQKMEAISKFSY